LRFSRILVLALVAAPATALLIERLVVTDEEAVTVRIEAASAAVANRDFAALRDALDEEYAADGRDREAAARYVEAQVRRYEPTSLAVDVRDVVVHGDVATAKAVLTGRTSLYGDSIVVEVSLRKRPDGWRITSAQHARVSAPLGR
jgi:hypothetical protein